MQRLRIILAISACALLVVPSVASARPGGRSFEGTYPYASRLCAKADAGKLPKRLAASSEAVKAACADLKASFAGAKDAYTTTVAPLEQQAKDAVAGARSACQAARVSGDAAACRTARQQARETLKGLRERLRTAKRTYHGAVQAARRTFWPAIRELRGGERLRADRTVGPGPSTELPEAV